MTQQEHLNRIRARCVKLLEIAEKITVQHAPHAQAGWKATIAAIDGIWRDAAEDSPEAEAILAAWPIELL